MVSRDLTKVLKDRYAHESATTDYLEELSSVSQMSELGKSARPQALANLHLSQEAKLLRPETENEMKQGLDSLRRRCPSPGRFCRDAARNGVDGLTAETLTGTCRSARHPRLPRVLFSLLCLEEIRSAESADDRFAKVIIAIEGRGKLAWRHESVDTLIDLILEHQGEDS